jgi:NAD(P)-dependent dehydrogenase (short-subunit alcohol dehydrogenase family)
MGNYLIIGGTSGIGNQIVRQLAENGNEMWVTGREEKNLEGLSVHFQRWDALNRTELELPEKLDGLIYAPGTINLKPFHRIKMDAFQEEMEVNYFGAVSVIQQVLPALKKSEHPSVVCFSTVAVGQGMPFHASIASAKGAVEGLIRSLAAEYAPAIRFNAIAPSLVDTPLAGRLLSSDDKREASNKRHPLKRVGSPSDLANAAVFLLSNQSSWVTGQIIGVDGGMSSIRPI